jgi:hypothetical protein
VTSEKNFANGKCLLLLRLLLILLLHFLCALYYVYVVTPTLSRTSSINMVSIAISAVIQTILNEVVSIFPSVYPPPPRKMLHNTSIIPRSFNFDFFLPVRHSSVLPFDILYSTC